MKEQISQDLAVASAKIGTVAVVNAATYTPGFTLSDLLIVCSIIFTVVQTFTVVIKNWGDWTAWLSARHATFRGWWQRLRSRG